MVFKHAPYRSLPKWVLNNNNNNIEAILNLFLCTPVSGTKIRLRLFHDRTVWAGAGSWAELGLLGRGLTVGRVRGAGRRPPACLCPVDSGPFASSC